MTQPITIPKELPRESTLNYSFLREEGIRHIQRLAGQSWTDHNTHDPGITILEQLCYAMTDLGYRIDHEIEDLLGSDEASTFKDLYSPARILTINPVTLLDIRKVVIDVPGVKNAWVEKVSGAISQAAEETAAPLQLKGLLRVVFEKNESADVNAGLVSKVRERLHNCRGICEDFEEIILLDTQLVRLHGTVEVGEVEDIHQFAAKVLLVANNYISPQVPFYTLQEMQGKGMGMDEIFDGPVLNHGFIDEEDLRKTNRKQELHTSAFVREIMDIKEVRAANELSLSTGSASVKKWVLPLDMSKTPKLDARGTLESLQFAKGGLIASMDKERVYQLFLQMRDQQQFEPLPLSERDIVLTETADRKLESYYSVQNQFPANYGIGDLGLADSASPQRRAQAKQLSAYLLFFEQLLANYFSQIAHFKDLMSFEGEDRRTYFAQSLLGSLPGLENILEDPEGYQAYLAELATDTPEGLERKNRFLNHLLARFSETFNDYGMLLHDSESQNALYPAQKLITDKSNFLKDYPELSGGKGKAFNYRVSFWDNANISGLEKRIARKLGVEDYSRRALGEENREGFHLVEHILLRPQALWANWNAPREISQIEASASSGRILCHSTGHGLVAGEEIIIQGMEAYNGSYTVEPLDEDRFEVESNFSDPVDPQSLPQWSRNLRDIRDWVFTDRVQAFTSGAKARQTRCEAPGHGLKEGESIEIIGTEDYNGEYQVSEVTEDSFEISHDFTQNEETARWKRSHRQGDPYSLQVSYFFPKWSERYKNKNFKTFVANIVREETPAHLSVRIEWLDKEEMQSFDRSYRHFLSLLQQK